MMREDKALFGKYLGQQRLMRSRRRPTIEKVILFTVVSFAMAISLALYVKRDTIWKANTMRYELIAHRNNVISFLLKTKKLPPNLAAVSLHLPEKDPFGAPYGYDPESGWVYSQTTGFENF